MPQIGASSPVRIVEPITPLGDGIVFANPSYAKIFQAKLFTASYKNPDAAPIADNANLDVLLVTPPINTATIDYRVSSTSAFELTIYEDTVTTNDGTPLPRRNRSRPLARNRAEALTYHTPTITNVGTLLLNEVSGILGGPIREEDRWVLKPNSKYLIRMINRSGAAQSMSITVNWFEER